MQEKEACGMRRGLWMMLDRWRRLDHGLSRYGSRLIRKGMDACIPRAWRGYTKARTRTCLRMEQVPGIWLALEATRRRPSRAVLMSCSPPHQLPGTYRGRTGPIGQHAIRPWPVAAEACRGLLPDPHHGTPLAPRHPTTKMGGGREGAAPALNALQTREAHRRFSCGRTRKPPSFD